MSLQLKIQIKIVSDPAVWRKLIVPEHFTFLQMHKVIQTAFGWKDHHLFYFCPKGYRSEYFIGIPDPDLTPGIRDAKQVKLSEIFTEPKQKFTYIYDFGDDWFHEITLEKITEGKSQKASCYDGKGTCPPEDCGGPWGYENLKKILANSKHPEHKEMKNWLKLGEKENWNVDSFDLEKTNELLTKI